MLRIIIALLCITIVAAAIFATIWIYQTKGKAPAAAATVAAATVAAATVAAAPVNSSVAELGISNNSSNADVNTIMNDLQVLVTQMQKAQCKNPYAKVEFDAMKANIIATLQSRGNVSCADLKALLSVEVSNLLTSEFDSVTAETIKTNLSNLYTHAINAVCVNNKVDVTKLGKLLDDIHSAIC